MLKIKLKFGFKLMADVPRKIIVSYKTYVGVSQFKNFTVNILSCDIKFNTAIFLLRYSTRRKSENNHAQVKIINDNFLNWLYITATNIRSGSPCNLRLQNVN